MGLRRPYIREASVYVPAPIGGWAADVSPALLPNTQAPILDNLIPFNGFVRMRGGIEYTDDLSSLSTTLATVGRIALTQPALGQFEVFMSQAARTATDYVDPWFAVRAKAVTGSGGVSQGSTGLIWRDRTTGNGHLILASLDIEPGQRWVAFGSQYYGISYAASTAPTTATLPDGSLNLRNTNLLTWGLATYSGSGAPPSPVAFPTTAPRGAVDIKIHLNRIWLLGGVDVPGGLTTNSPTKVFYTNVGTGGTLGTVAADWKDSITGSTNQFELDQDYNDPGVGFAVWRNQLIIFRDHSVWIVQGTTSTTFQAKRISQDVGCIDAKSILETDNGVYFLSQRGLMFTDGTSIRNVSGPVQSNLEAACNFMYAATLNFGGWATLVPLSDGIIMVSIGQLSSATLPHQIPIWSGCYNPFTGTWWRFTSQLFSGDNTGGAENALFPGQLFTPVTPRDAVFSVGDKKLVLIDGLGTNIVSGQITQGPGLFDRDDTGVPNPHFYSIPAKWRSRSTLGLSPGPPQQRMALHQMRLDHTFARDTNFVTMGITTGWLAKVLDASNGQILGASLNSSIGSAPVQVAFDFRAVPSIQRDYAWDFSEADDAFFEVTWPTGSFGPSAGGASQRLYELYGIGLSFVPGAREPLP